jgi:hypothetical protein
LRVRCWEKQYEPHRTANCEPRSSFEHSPAAHADALLSAGGFNRGLFAECFRFYDADGLGEFHVADHVLLVIAHGFLRLASLQTFCR